MRRLHALLLASWVFLAPIARAADAQYVTDIPAYSILARCAANALSDAITAQSYSASCGGSQDEQQSCICSNEDVLDRVTSSISGDISVACGGRSASDDQRSASLVLNQYCEPDATVEFWTPTKNIVNAYITELSEMAWLPPCASDGLSSAVMQESQSRCPEEASLFAPCVCSKDNVVKDVSKTISQTVRYSCSNDEDVTAAYKLYNEYCAMNEGTTSFATPPGPKGDMTYHITALPQFKSLNNCARTGVSSAIFDQTYSFCASGPQALASCVCMKSGMRYKVSSTLTSDVKNFCEVTATADVSSALDVLDYYCSAAAGDVVAEVSESVSETYPTAQSRTGSETTSPSETGGSSDGGGGGGGGEGGSDGAEPQDGGSGSGGGGANRTATIAASVLGGVVAIAIIIGIGIYIRRKKKKAAQKSSPVEPPPYLGHPELQGDESRTDIVKAGSPAVSERYPAQAELGDRGIVEMPNQTQPGELQSQSSADRYVPYHQAQEMPGSASGNQWPMQSPQQSQASVSPMSPEQQGMGWQAGPVESYEMDSMSRRTRV